MKDTMVAILLLAFSSSLFSQQSAPVPYSHHYDYLQKSKRQQRAGIILLSAGTAVTFGGVVLFADGINRTGYAGTELNGSGAEVVVGALVTVLGVAAMSTSIPFFIGAHRSRKRALDISLQTENAPALCKTAFTKQAYPALALHIPLGK